MFEKILILLFLVTVPAIHPDVSSDGRGYYAYLRSPLIDHNFSFATDWNDAPERIYFDCRKCPPEAKLYWNHPAHTLLFAYLNGRIYANPITKTGHLPNFYTVGPAILWAPFVSAAHLAVLAANRLGYFIPADGHSWPYIVSLSVSTALYGFIGLWFSFRLAKKYVEERWAFWATVGMWFASALPMYMYFLPSLSHADSVFCVALFIWYWDRTRMSRSLKQWFTLGAIAGLMVDVYLVNAILLVIPGLECVAAYTRSWRDVGLVWKELRAHVLFVAGAALAFSPMLIARLIVFGSPFEAGIYTKVPWNWTHPAFWGVLFSNDHGIMLWTPVVLVGFLGLLPLWRRQRLLGGAFFLATLAFYCLISFYPWWNGSFTFANRFFVSLTPIFTVGLAAAFSAMARFWKDSRAATYRFVTVLVLLILWNVGLMYQWCTDLVAVPGHVYWNEVVYNQFRVVPQHVLDDLTAKIHKPV